MKGVGEEKVCFSIDRHRKKQTTACKKRGVSRQVRRRIEGNTLREKKTEKQCRGKKDIKKVVGIWD